jgi:4-carboxymuconolactone decarboxylase
MLSVTLLAALGKRDELKTHVLGALNNGVTKEEIQEVLLHTTVYAGFPVGLESFRMAKELFDELEAAEARKDEDDPE